MGNLKWWKAYLGSPLILGLTLGQCFVLVFLIATTAGIYSLGNLWTSDLTWGWVAIAITILALTFPGPATWPFTKVRNLYLSLVRPMRIPAPAPSIIKTLGMIAGLTIVAWLSVPVWCPLTWRKTAELLCFGLGLMVAVTIIITHLEETSGGVRPWLSRDRFLQICPIKNISDDGVLTTVSKTKIVVSALLGNLGGRGSELASDDRQHIFARALFEMATFDQFRGGVISLVTLTSQIEADSGVSEQKLLFLVCPTDIESELRDQLLEVELEVARLDKEQVLAFIGEVLRGNPLLETLDGGTTGEELITPTNISFGAVAQLGDRFLGLVTATANSGNSFAKIEAAAYRYGAHMHLNLYAAPSEDLEASLQGRLDGSFLKSEKRDALRDLYSRVFASGPESPEFLYRASVTLMVHGASEKEVTRKVAKLQSGLRGIPHQRLQGRALERAITSCIPVLSVENPTLNLLKVTDKLMVASSEVLGSELSAYMAEMSGSDLTFILPGRNTMVIGQGTKPGQRRRYHAEALRDLLVTIVLGIPGKGKTVWMQAMFMRIGHLRRYVLNPNPADETWKAVVLDAGGTILESQEPKSFRQDAYQAIFKTRCPVLYQSPMGTLAPEEDPCALIFLELIKKRVESKIASVLLLDEAHVYMHDELERVGKAASKIITELVKKARNNHMAVMIATHSLTDFQNRLGQALNKTFIGFGGAGVKVFFNLSAAAYGMLRSLGFPEHLVIKITGEKMLIGHYFVISKRTFAELRLRLNAKEKRLLKRPHVIAADSVPRMRLGQRPEDY